MYRPPPFREDRREVLLDAIAAHPLGMLVTAGAAGLVANALPFTLHSGEDGDVLRAHLAKGNDQVAELRAQTPALAIFQGPHAYVSPSWYPTKHAHGKAVPTWNYVMVQAWGTPAIVEDAAWLRAQLHDLTRAHEAARPEPWRIEDAPADYVAGLLKGIVGLEIPIERIEGKWKVSQNQPITNRIGVAEGLRADGHHALADEVAARGGL